MTPLITRDFRGILPAIAVLLIASTLQVGCASRQSVEDIQATIETYNAALEKNQLAQSDIKAQLVRLEIDGKADSEKARTLREKLAVLISEQQQQAQQVAKIRSSVKSNSSAIQAMKAEEEKRNKAVERLNKSYEAIEQKTSQKMQAIETKAPEPEGE